MWHALADACSVRPARSCMLCIMLQGQKSLHRVLSAACVPVLVTIALENSISTMGCITEPLLAIAMLHAPSTHSGRVGVLAVSAAAISASSVDNQLRNAERTRSRSSPIMYPLQGRLPVCRTSLLLGGQCSVSPSFNGMAWKPPGPFSLLTSWRCQSPRFPSQPSYHPRRARPRPARPRHTPP